MRRIAGKNIAKGKEIELTFVESDNDGVPRDPSTAAEGNSKRVEIRAC